jgi:ribonuclease HI
MTIVALTNFISIQFSQTVSQIIFESIDEKYISKKKEKKERKKEKKGKGKKERFITFITLFFTLRDLSTVCRFYDEIFQI